MTFFIKANKSRSISKCVKVELVLSFLSKNILTFLAPWTPKTTSQKKKLSRTPKVLIGTTGRHLNPSKKDLKGYNTSLLLS